MIKVLHIVSSLDGGGVENMLYNYYAHLDRNKIRFDFVVHGTDVGLLEEKLICLNSQIYHVISKHTNLIKNLIETNSIIKKGNYDIVHCHQGPKGAFALFCAKLSRVKIRIIHNHIAFVPETKIQMAIRKLYCWVANKLATHYFACGRDAGVWAYGQGAIDQDRVTIINNAIETKKFVFNKEIREIIRKEFCVENKSVIGCIARLSSQKNHEFLVEMFYQIKKVKSNVVLWLIGDGPLLNDIKEYVNSLGISNDVFFLGVRNDVERIMQGMDLFLLPTRFEGLGIVYVEAQAAGLRTIASSRVVPKETKVTNLISYIDLEAPVEFWAEKVCEALNEYERNDLSHEIAMHGYEISIESQKLENHYLELSHNGSKY